MGSLWDGEICRSSAAIARIALIALAACGAGAARPVPAPIGNTAPVGAVSPGDPAHIAGRWLYRASTDCNDGQGSGWVAFAWNPDTGTYDETGEVDWLNERIEIRWESTARVDYDTGRIVSRGHNTLGDAVGGTWIPDATPPRTLTLAWNQTNGCAGSGSAERPEDDAPDSQSK